MLHRALVALPCALALFACSTPVEGEPDAGHKHDAGDPGGGPPLLGGLNCDALVPSTCGFPWPSDTYLVDDAKTVTGKHVEFGPVTLPMYFGEPMDRTAFEDADGWSAGAGLLTHMPGATIAGLPSQDTIEESLGANSPTVVIEAETGARVPHWAELDATTANKADQTFIIRPVVRLKDKTRYIVAIRHVKDSSNKDLEASDLFKAFRDGTASSDKSYAPRKTLYEGIFAKLQAAGIAKADLQLAWDFTTASKENNTRVMLSMRDKAFALVGDEGPQYRINEVQSNPNSHIWKRIKGELRVPLFLNKPGAPTGEKDVAGAHMLVGEDGLPIVNKDTPWAWYRFQVQIPNSAKNNPEKAALLAQGHGLLGDLAEGQDGYLAVLQDPNPTDRPDAPEGGYVTITVDLQGMMEDDHDAITYWITNDMSQFRQSVDRQHQGMINQLLAMRMMMGRFQDEKEARVDGTATGKLAYDRDLRFYRGDSQGGIMGATYMALSPDVERGYLGEPGEPYNLLLNRSRDFDEFLVVLGPTYVTNRNTQLVLQLLDMLWDRAEPTGYSPYVTSDNLPGVSKKQILINAALGDQQVTPLGAHIMARTMGMKLLKPAARQVYGLEAVDGPLPKGQSAMQEFTFGLKDVPKTNIPPRDKDGFPENDDPHDWVRKLAGVNSMTDKFFKDGVIKTYCADTCAYPKQ